MATRITIKLYNYYGEFVKRISLVSRVAFYDAKHVETTLVHVEPQPKRPTKNLESLIKALNKQGYTVSLTQIYCHNEFSWSCFIHDDKRSGNIYGGSERNQKTAYLAVKAAIPKYGWYELEA